MWFTSQEPITEAQNEEEEDEEEEASPETYIYIFNLYPFHFD